jgi:hypothetical protein
MRSNKTQPCGKPGRFPGAAPSGVALSRCAAAFEIPDVKPRANPPDGIIGSPRTLNELILKVHRIDRARRVSQDRSAPKRFGNLTRHRSFVPNNCGSVMRHVTRRCSCSAWRTAHANGTRTAIIAIVFKPEAIWTEPVNCSRWIIDSDCNLDSIGDSCTSDWDQVARSNSPPVCA